MSRKPEFGVLVAALSLIVLALGWALALLPLGAFPLTLGGDGHGAYVARVRNVPASYTGGIAPGDRLDLSALSYAQRWRLQGGAQPGSALTLRVRHDGVWSNRVIVASLVTLPMGDPRWWSVFAGMTVGVLIASVVVARRPSVATAAFAFYMWGALPSFRFIMLFSWLPDPVFGVVATVLEALVASFPVFLLLIFVTRFPAEPSSAGGRLRMRIADAALFAGIAICFAFAVFEPVRHHTWSNVADLFGIVVVAFGGVLAALQYREASGEDRRRIGWVLAGYGVTLTSFVATNAIITAPALGSSELQVATQLADIALPLALAYAILRHRVLDVGFAINRTVVYAAVTTVVVVAVSLVDWLAGKLIGETRLALAAEAAVTIALGVALNAMHERIGRFVERVLFRARHTAERRLRNGIEALAFTATDAAIERALTDEISAALGLRSTALFRLDEETNRFRCVRATGWPDAVATIDEDALLVRTLRLRERPFHLADFAIAESGLPAGPSAPMLAVPVADRHALRGFVLYGALSDGTAPDPELVDLLGQLGAAAAAASAYVDARAARSRLADIEKLLATGASTVSGLPG
ncbi:MAG: hypothetical protein JWO85_1038 [Candidatus Eremiobacteraeota bacterium]|nr:hypothetical protein [Candidatus Eremiobacteraeota bacterium]